MRTAPPGTPSTVVLQPTNPASQPALGQECRFALRGGSPASVEYFLEQEGIFYPRPLPTEPDGSVRLFPEAPGCYVLHARWRSPDDAGGWARLEILINGPSDGREPLQAKVEDRTKLWVPTAWDAAMISAHERPVFRELERVVRPGATVYDIGANVGLFAMRFARWIGETGWLYAVEPNPVCVYFLRANLERVRARNFTILPIAIADRRGECAFTVNYGSTLVGAGGDLPGLTKPGHRIRVDADSLDRIIADWGLRPPDVVKLDVEGAEGSAVAGMMETLAACRPALMIELHGREAASQALGRLAALDYRYVVPSIGQTRQTAEALLASMPDACIQAVGFP